MQKNIFNKIPGVFNKILTISILFTALRNKEINLY